MRILAFGDSITQGFFDKDGGWVNRLREYFDSIKIQNNDLSQPTVFNMGISGDFTSSVLSRAENETKARKWPGEDFIFILAIGTNDTLYRGDEYESTPKQYREELNKIYQILKKYSQKFLLVGLFPVVDRLVQPLPVSETGKCYSTERMKSFDETLRNFCKDNSLPYVDIWQKFEEHPDLEELLFDGVHPNDKGHKLIFETIRPELEEMLE